ncbi:MAG: hypothetical protein WBA13_08715 [Microcoleaceae cyanobacterium]
MNSTSQKPSSKSSLLSAQNLVIFGIIWAVLSLLFFLLFSVTPEGEDLPLWYQIGTYVFELGAFLGAAVVCYRNWQSPQVVSGRNVWLGFCLGTLCYFIAGVLFGFWELVWGLDPDVSAADLFYILTYLFLAWGMIVAVSSKRLNLEIWQAIAVTAVAIAGTALAIWVSDPTFFGLVNVTEPTVAEVTVDPSITSTTAAPDISPAAIAEEDTVEAVDAPAWVIALDQKLEPFAFGVNLFYVIADVFLLILATALILAFWGGRFSQSWRMIAFAIFSLYVADMYFKWADARATAEYESGGLLEVFFVFTGVLFAIGAVLEYDISTRSRQSRRSRRSNARN